MTENKLPKVLAVTINAWRKDSGIHTVSDIFKFWQPDRLAQIYTRSAYPDTDICNSFFRISESGIIKSVINRKPVGERVSNKPGVAGGTSQQEIKLYANAHKKKKWFMTLLREIVWKFGKWKTKALDDYLKEENPDCIFFPIYPVIYMGWIQKYVVKKTGKPYVCYLFDDNYTYKPCGMNVFALIHRFFLRRVVRSLAKGCSEMFVITDIQKEETDRLLGTNSKVLTKGIDLSKFKYEKTKASYPVKMVYAGKMIIGREATLMLIADALKEINKDGIKIEFDIYSQDVLSEKNKDKMSSNGCSFKGQVERQEIEKILRSADILVFVESLSKKDRYTARMSFSTKITDYLMSGKCIFAIGDEDIAPIKYFRNNDSAIIATSPGQIADNLRRLSENPDIIEEYGEKAYLCGKKNHNIDDIKEVFCQTMILAAKKG